MQETYVEQETGTKEPPPSNRGVRIVESGKSNTGKDGVTRGYPDYVITANVDWLTATTSSERRGQAWMEIFQQVRKLQVEGKLIFETKEWRALGYRGYTVGQLRYGYSSRLGYIIIASGALTPDLWKSFLGDPVKVTRIDLACTVQFACAHEAIARLYYEDVIARIEAGKSFNGRKYMLIQNSRQGETLYVGSSKSEMYGRVYDKGVEENASPSGFKWRYEVEYKKPTSGRIAASLDAVGKREQSSVVATVYDWFDSKGVSPLFRREGDALRLQTEVLITTLDKKVSWLRQQVRPTVMQLISCGRSEDCLDALGLTGWKPDGKGEK